MRSFVIELPKKEKDPTGTLKSYLLNKVWNQYPWLTDDATSSFPASVNISYAGPGDGLHFGKKQSLYDVSFSAKDYLDELKSRKANKNTYYSPFDVIYTNDNVNNDNVDVYNLYDDFRSAMNRVKSYAYHKRFGRKSYDFLLDDGTPVTVLSVGLQVGNEIIPYPTTYNTFKALPKTTLVVIKKITVSVSTYLVA